MTELTHTATAERAAEETAMDDPQALARADRPLPGRPDDRARRDDRERRAAVDPGRPRLLRDVARLGRERLPAHVRRLPAARRPAGRPLRAPAAVPDRHRALHGRLARLRPRRLAGAPRRRARRAGARRRDRLGGRALADDDAVHRAGRAREGDGRLRLRRCSGGGTIGVLLGGVLTDALDWHWIFLVNLPIGVARLRRSRCALLPGRARPRGARPARRRGRRDRDRLADARRVRDRQRQPERLDVGQTLGLLGRRGRAARRRSS